MELCQRFDPKLTSRTTTFYLALALWEDSCYTQRLKCGMGESALADTPMYIHTTRGISWKSSTATGFWASIEVQRFVL